MRILIVSTAYLPLVGGAELAVKEITDRLDGYSFDLVTHRVDSTWSAEEKIGNINVFRVGPTLYKGEGNYYGHKFKKLLWAGLGFFKALQLHRKNQYDVIWSVTANYSAAVAMWFKIFKPRVPLLLTLQEGDSEEHITKRVGGLFLPFWKWFFKMPERVQVISKYLGDFARRYGATAPIDVVPNGVSIENFKAQRSNAKKNRKIIITTSRLVYKNGIDTLIRATRELGDYKLLVRIIGGGPDEKELKDLVRELGVENVIEFIGHVDPDRVADYLKDADIFVRASRSEGLGNVFLEAMAAGLPIIGTNVGGIPDFLHNRETGLFTRVDDPKDLAGKIKLLIEDGDLRRKLVSNGKKLVKEKYTWNIVSSDMNKVFKNTLGKSLRVLIATGLYPPEIGGPATHTVLMEQEMPNHNVEVSVLPFREVRHLPKGISHIFYFVKCWWRALRHDVVFAQDTVSVGFPASLAALFAGRPFVVRVPGDHAWEQAKQRFGVKDGIDEFQHKEYGLRVGFLRALRNFSVRRASVVVTPSNYFNKLVSRWTKTSHKVKTIYNGIKIGTKNKELSIKEGEKVLVSVGRLVPWKGFDVLIEVMKDLPDWSLVIVGSGPEEDRLELKIKKLGLAERVVMVGRISNEDVFKQYKKADIFVLNTSFESFSFQTVEAMSVGLPVVVTNVGSLPEVVGKGGILVEPDDKEQICTAINKLGKDDGFYKEISQSAQEQAQKFSIENTADSFARVFKSLIPDSRHRE